MISQPVDTGIFHCPFIPISSICRATHKKPRRSGVGDYAGVSRRWRETRSAKVPFWAMSSS